MKRAQSVLGLSYQALKVKWDATNKLTRYGMIALALIGGLAVVSSARCLVSSACPASGGCPNSASY